MFDNNRSSGVTVMPSTKLLYTPKPEEYMNDCDYEKTVLIPLLGRGGR